jgi:hypothetical protein
MPISTLWLGPRENGRLGVVKAKAELSTAMELTVRVDEPLLPIVSTCAELDEPTATEPKLNEGGARATWGKVKVGRAISMAMNIAQPALKPTNRRCFFNLAPP